MSPPLAAADILSCRQPGDGFNSKVYKLVTAPEKEPVTLDEVKAFLKIDGAEEDSVLNLLISASRRRCEDYCVRSFITQTWRLTMDAFSDYETSAEGLAPYSTEGQRSIRLGRGPVASVESIKYFDTANDESTVGNIYVLSEGRVLLNSGAPWPSNLRETGGVVIEFKAGYGEEPEEVPEPIRQAVLMMVSALYESRGCADMPEGVKSILEPYREVEAYGGW